MSSKKKKEMNWPKDETHWNTWLPKKYGKCLFGSFLLALERSGAEIGSLTVEIVHYWSGDRCK